MSDTANPLKTYHQRQIQDQAQPVRLYGPDGGPPSVQLSGSLLTDAEQERQGVMAAMQVLYDLAERIA